MLKIISISICCVAVISCASRVNVEQGILQGSQEELSDGRLYYSFKGIPYAQPPLGELRFQAPRPPLKWTGVKNATQHGPPCMQYDERLDKILDGSEDCLFLNVYTKDLKPKTPQPVLFWIHGGSFTMGSGDSDHYSPEFLLGSDDVVVVTINYRLEVLGFLNLGTPEVPGNAGLKDQVAALRWVRDNIDKFGGDKNNVTIAGCSAGAAVVTLHMLSPMSKGLFHKAIAMSGAAYNTMTFSHQSIQRGYQLAESLGLKAKDPKEVVEFMKNVPSLKITKVLLPDLSDGLNDVLQFGPVIEKVYPNTDAFITKPPEEIILEGDINKVPLMIGTTDAEGIEIARHEPIRQAVINDFSFIVPVNIKRKCKSKEQIIDISRRIKEFYFGSKNITDETLNSYVDLMTDAYFLYDVDRFANAVSEHCPVYYYQFAYESERNIFKKMYNMSHVNGVCHGDDLFYPFDATFLPIIPRAKGKTLDFTKQYCKLWTNFMIYGNPTPDGSPAYWNALTQSEKNYLKIDEKFNTSVYLEKERMMFWDSIAKEVN